jgi:rhamnulokinase
VPCHLAIDLGAGSGRAIVGQVHPSGLVLREVHRFHYGPRRAAGHLRWNFGALLEGMRVGIRQAPPVARDLGGRIESVGVDSWGVDYGLVDDEGRLLEDPVSYRDERTEGVMDEVFARLAREEIFARTGIQFMALNTLYQLFAHARDGLSAGATRLLMIPDLCHHELCGSLVGEHTNASTTQLLNVHDGSWDPLLFERLDLPRALMPEVVAAGTEIGTLRTPLQEELGVGPLRVIAPATHDTGSAVLGTPLEPGWAYISSGTWSLVGVERDSPLVDTEVARANFTNEGGAFGTTRFLKNVMGLWMLEECRREWQEAGEGQEYAELLERVQAMGECAGFVFPDHPRFFNPPSMTAEIRAALAESGQPAPDVPAGLARVILDSLALRYASVIDSLEGLTGQQVPGIHIVGGGSQNAYLDQATADATGRPVLAGPVEATASGNVLAQAIVCGEVSSLSEGRRLLGAGVQPRRFTPRDRDRWVEAAHRYREIEEAHARSAPAG